MGASTAIIGSSLLSAGTSIGSAIYGSSGSYDSSGAVLQMLVNQQLAGLQAESTLTTSKYSADLIEKQSEAESLVSDYNAAQYDYAADTAIAEGNISAQKEHRTFQATEGAARAAYAAGGIAVEGGETSAGDVQETNQTQYYLDRDLILYGADLTAAQYRNQAKLAEYQSGVSTWLGEQKATLTRSEGELSAAATKAGASAQNMTIAANASTAASNYAAQASNALLTGFTSAAKSLANGWADYEKVNLSSPGYTTVNDFFKTRNYTWQY